MSTFDAPVIQPDPDHGARVTRDDRPHVFHSWSAQALIAPLPIAGASGSHFWDFEGTRYLDFSSQLVNVNIGYQHPKLVAAIQEAARDSAYAGILMRVDSPGGFGPAADAIWRAVVQARESKPVVVSMSDLAASGGYYIAAKANRIVAEAGTLTGSIGVAPSGTAVGEVGVASVGGGTGWRGQVSEALVATAAGLVLAVISATLYALFRNRAQSLISEMESATTHIIGLLAVATQRRRDSISTDEA